MAAFLVKNLSAKEICISTKGNNLNPATKGQPLAIMEGAREVIRQLRNSGNLSKEVRVMVDIWCVFHDRAFDSD